MPTYAYRCEKCSVEFERFQKFSDKPLTKCPECKGKVRRVPQAAGVVFKGSGWYITDSKSASSATSTAKSKKNETEGGGGETKTESKPAEKAKTETKPAAPKSED
jgi:putative FmdB family regulatory protein